MKHSWPPQRYHLQKNPIQLDLQVLDYTRSGGKSWRLVGSLPSPLYATRAANVAGTVLLAGGYDGELTLTNVVGVIRQMQGLQKSGLAMRS